jgi:hypothetical protein
MERELKPDELEAINNVVVAQNALGFESKAKEFYSGQLNLNKADYLKVNLPDSLRGFNTGDGEGIWACPVSSDDIEIYKADVKGSEFFVYALNDCICYPIKCASIIKVKCTGGCRPVLSYEWIDEIIQKASKGGMSLSKMLSD